MDYSPPKNTIVQLLQKRDTEEPAIEYRRRLVELSEAMDVAHAFHKGQFVKWKAGLKNRKEHAYNEVAVVREILTKSNEQRLHGRIMEPTIGTSS